MRRYLAVNPLRKSWCLQWATPTQFGHKFVDPIEEGFKTKKEAQARKREILRTSNG
jgi:hypothetical protein